jgi:hypothetical protein
VTAASLISDAGFAKRPRVLLADDHPAMLALTGRSPLHLANNFLGRKRINQNGSP